MRDSYSPEMPLERVVKLGRGQPNKQRAAVILILAWMGVMCLRAATAGADEPAPLAAPAGQSLPTDTELESSGAVFGDIEIDNKDVFDKEDPKDNKALFRLANKLHVRTRRSVIRHQLLFRSGEPYSRHVMDESARILRADRYFYDASIEPVRYHDGKVDVLVITRDVWTLDPGLNFGRSGGTNSTGVSLQELNILGTGSAVGIGHQSAVDRSESSVRFSNEHAFGTWTSVNLNYAQLSDGAMRQAIIDSPFYSLETHHAGGVVAQSIDQSDHLYDRGQVIDQFHDHSVYAQIYAGWSAGLQNGWVRRWSTGITYDERRFSPDTTWVHPFLLPQDRKFAYPWIRFDLVQDRYVTLANRDQIGRIEDFSLGTYVTAQLGWADSAFGSSRSAALFMLAAGRGAMPTVNTTLLMTSVFTGRVEDGILRNGVLDAAIRYYVQQTKDLLLFTTVHAANGWRLDLENQLTLGGDNGLRGYPLRYQDGTGRALFTVEERYFTDWYPFRLFRVGAAVFADAGQTWGNAPLAQRNLGLLEDAGFGLRFGNARSGFGNVFHLDFAFPLNVRPGIDKAQVLLQTEASF